MGLAEVELSVRTSFGDGFEAYAVSDMARLTRLASMLSRDGDSARDLVQETLARVGAAWGRIDRDANPAGYANTTMSRLAWRQRERMRTELALMSHHRSTAAASSEYARVDDASQLVVGSGSPIRACCLVRRGRRALVPAPRSGGLHDGVLCAGSFVPTRDVAQHHTHGVDRRRERPLSRHRRPRRRLRPAAQPRSRARRRDPATAAVSTSEATASGPPTSTTC